MFFVPEVYGYISIIFCVNNMPTLFSLIVAKSFTQWLAFTIRPETYSEVMRWNQNVY